MVWFLSQSSMAGEVFGVFGILKSGRELRDLAQLVFMDSFDDALYEVCRDMERNESTDQQIQYRQNSLGAWGCTNRWKRHDGMT